MTPAGIEPATFRFIAEQLNHCAVYNILYCYNLMGPPSHMRSVVDRNVVMLGIPVITSLCYHSALSFQFNYAVPISTTLLTAKNPGRPTADHEAKKNKIGH